MSWLKVRKDNVELFVSHESYKDLFSKQGFEVVKDLKPAQMQSEKKEPGKTVKVKEPVEKKAETIKKGGQPNVHK